MDTPEKQKRKEIRAVPEVQNHDIARKSADDVFDDEFAAEVSPYNPGTGTVLNEPEQDRPTQTSAREFRDNETAAAPEGAMMGWVAIITAIISLFVWPAVLGPAAAVLGFIAYARGNRGLGVWSIVIGVIAVIAYFALVPYYA